MLETVYLQWGNLKSIDKKVNVNVCEFLSIVFADMGVLLYFHVLTICLFLISWSLPDGILIRIVHWMKRSMILHVFVYFFNVASSDVIKSHGNAYIVSCILRA